MDKSVFDFKDYRSFLIERLGAAGKRTGLRAQACKALGCHSTYLSQVLNAKTELSLEYGEAMNRFFHHDDDEGSYFLLLLLKERAGSVHLKERFLKQIDSVQAMRATLKKRNKESTEITLADQDRFYSSWIYGALHVLASLPLMKTNEDLAKALGISRIKAAEAIKFLQKVGLLNQTQKGFEIGSRHIHLGADSQLIQKHHTNWRFHAIQSLGDRNPKDLHYSGAVSLSIEGAEQIRENLMKAFQANMQIVKDAKEEVAYVYNFDFYKLGVDA